MDSEAGFAATKESQREDNSPNVQTVLGVYQEICKSVHDIDDFRMKLLGLLPLTSLTGIFALNNQSFFAQSNPESQHLIAFISIFAASLTLSLFIYEIRGILRCHNLVQKGEKIEKELKIHGQFSVCTEEHKFKKEGEGWRNKASNFFDPKLAACVIYSIVFAAWIFTAIRFGFKWQILGCALTALGFGLLIGIGAFKFVKNLVAT